MSVRLEMAAVAGLWAVLIVVGCIAIGLDDRGHGQRWFAKLSGWSTGPLFIAAVVYTVYIGGVS